jgi:hypothetical protein
MDTSAIFEKLGLKQATVAERVTAHMHLHAVLPRLGDLIRLDAEARELARGLRLSLDFVVLGGPRAHVAFDDGRFEHGPGRAGFPALGLVFPSCRRLNRMFAGEKILPIPAGGLHQLPRVKRFEALTARLTRYLKPSAEDLADPGFRARHVELALLTGLDAACQVGLHDPAAARIMPALHDGVIQFRVHGGPSAHVRIEQGRLRASAGEAPAPTATLVLKDLDFAAALIRGEVDAFSAVGATDIRMHGDLFMADEFNALFDRVGLYLS